MTMAKIIDRVEEQSTFIFCLARSVFRTLSNIYDGAFMQKKAGGF